MSSGVNLHSNKLPFVYKPFWYWKVANEI